MAKPLSALHQYVVVTGAYWAFTLTDGALRMLVLFHFHKLGYSSLEIAFLFIFYEFFGILTNLYGGWLGARFGLRLTLWAGLLLQILALVLLIPVSASWPKLFSVIYVMAAQALSGIAKDLNKMSAKGAIKTVVPATPGNEDKGEQQLFQWVALRWRKRFLIRSSVPVLLAPRKGLSSINCSVSCSCFCNRRRLVGTVGAWASNC